MILGVGIDLCEVGRMEKLVEDGRFMKRYFTEAENEYVLGRGRKAAETMAGIFAAKEAFAKAMGTGITFELKEAEVVHDERGCPGYRLSGRAAEVAAGSRFGLSSSHDGGVAGAVCIREEA